MINRRAKLPQLSKKSITHHSDDNNEEHSGKSLRDLNVEQVELPARVATSTE